MTQMTIYDCSTAPSALTVTQYDTVEFINTCSTQVTIEFLQNSPFPTQSITVVASSGGVNGTSYNTVTNSGVNCPFEISGTNCPKQTTISGEIDVNP